VVVVLGHYGCGSGLGAEKSHLADNLPRMDGGDRPGLRIRADFDRKAPGGQHKGVGGDVADGKKRGPGRQIDPFERIFDRQGLFFGQSLKQRPQRWEMSKKVRQQPLFPPLGVSRMDEK
jgi:hypothetical protein